MQLTDQNAILTHQLNASNATRLPPKNTKLHKSHEHTPGMTRFHKHYNSIFSILTRELCSSLQWTQLSMILSGKTLDCLTQPRGKSYLYKLPSSCLNMAKVSQACCAWHIWRLEEEESWQVKMTWYRPGGSQVSTRRAGQGILHVEKFNLCWRLFRALPHSHASMSCIRKPASA